VFVFRYEKGQRQPFGSALVQRHVALPQDIANKEGKGLLVSITLAGCAGVHYARVIRCLALGVLSCLGVLGRSFAEIR
jgi:hypothetical protein